MLDHKWVVWEKKENVMAYEIVCESESKRYRSDCASVLTKTCEILKSKNIKKDEAVPFDDAVHTLE